MIRFPTSVEHAARESASGASIRAGATDLQERRALGLSHGPLVDLRDLDGCSSITWREDGSAEVGAKVTVSQLASDVQIASRYPGISAAAGGLATPQIRAIATVGGNLLQQVRCWYFRRAGADCFKAGGSHCPARAGDQLYSVCIDQGPCIAPHPSTIAMALLAYDATVEVVSPNETRRLTMTELLGDGKDPRVTSTLRPGDVLTKVILPVPLKDERAAYFRAISRARAEWSLVEAIARVCVRDGRFVFAKVAVGGVANTPLLRTMVDQALLGQLANEETIRSASAHAADDASPLPMTEYKVPLLRATVQEALEMAVRAP